MLHLELASAMATAQQSGEQSTAVPHRAWHHVALHIGIAADNTLIALIFFPKDITLVVLTDQHLPRILRPANATRDHFTPGLEMNLRTGPAKRVGAGINWIGQQPMHRIVTRQSPFHHSPPRTVDDHRHLNALLVYAEGELADTADLRKFFERQRQRVMH